MKRIFYINLRITRYTITLLSFWFCFVLYIGVFEKKL